MYEKPRLVHTLKNVSRVILAPTTITFEENLKMVVNYDRNAPLRDYFEN